MLDLISVTNITLFLLIIVAIKLHNLIDTISDIQDDVAQIKSQLTPEDYD